MRGRTRDRRAVSYGLETAFSRLFTSGTSGDSWLDSASYVIGSSGKVESFRDRIDPTHLVSRVDAGGTTQVAVPSLDSTVAGAPTAVFTGVQYYQSSRAASSFRFMHDGTGSTEIVVGVPTAAADGTLAGLLQSTAFQPNSGTGANLYTFQATSRMYVLNAGALPCGFANSGATPSETPTFLAFSLATGAYSFSLKSTVKASGTPGALGVGVDPSFTFTLGAFGDLAYKANMRWCASFLWRRVLTAADLAVVYAYIQKRYGIAP